MANKSPWVEPGNSGEKKLSFNRQKPRTEPGSMVGGHLLLTVERDKGNQEKP